MGYFSTIKEGELPQDELLVYIRDNGVDDEYKQYAQEIDKHIFILAQNFEQANHMERIFLLKVLFVLESYKDLQYAKEMFVRRVIRTNFHDIDQDFVPFFISFIEKYDVDFLIEQILFRASEELDKLPNEELRSFFNWSLHIIWNISKFHNNTKWTSLYENLKLLLDELIAQQRIADVMYVEFFIYHIMGNSFQNIDQWRAFNKEVTKRTENFYKNYAQKLPRATPSKKQKKRIAFVVDRTVFNSVFQVQYSLFQALMNDEEFTKNYEMAVYTANYFEKSQDDPKCIKMIEELGIPYINPVHSFIKDGYYNNHYEKALQLRQTLVNDDIDILIAGGVFPIIDFLYLSRVAPLQIYYSHGNCAFDIEGIDKRISHFSQECKEFEWGIVNVPMEKQFLVGTDGEKQVGEIIKADFKQKYGDDLVVLGTIGRLIKINSDEYIKTIAEIMKQNPNTIYLACGIGNEEDVKEKVRKYGIDEERFIFTGQINSHIYGWVIDVWCETFPHRQGQSRNEFEAKGGAIIGYKKYYNQNAIIDIENLSKELNIPTPLSNSLEEFVVITNNLIKDKKLRQKTGLLYKQLREFYSQFDFNQVKKVLDCK